jgi:general secretion pathway protein A
VFPTETLLEVHRQSRGFPRLVNTLCENALIHGYARQLHSIPPEVIEEIAADFRLNIEHRPLTEYTAPDAQSTEVARAAKTLLDLYSYLRNAQEGGADLRVTLGGGARKNEPYI